MLFTYSMQLHLFSKLPWSEDSEKTYRSSSQATNSPPVPFTAERQAGKL